MRCSTDALAGSCIDELFELYDAVRDGRTPALPPAPSFRMFLEWLAARDTASSAPFWRGLFATFDPHRPAVASREAAESLPIVAKQSVRLSRTPQ